VSSLKRCDDKIVFLKRCTFAINSGDNFRRVSVYFLDGVG
jgi:hypothetical protein